ncbi:MAG: CPBP family intramembrane metalloprotease [Sphingobacteriales bacterium]|nr:MAG: CPBP family intramembrane metalloprotease [Sphingobacteriales bacterium]
MNLLYHKIKENFLNHKKTKFYFVLIICFGLLMVNANIFLYISDYFSINLEGDSDFDSFSKKSLFFLAVVFAPLTETFLCQILPYYILKNLKLFYLRIILPSILFGVLHDYSWLYMLATFFVGVVLNYLYFYCVAHRRNAYLYVAALHSLYNLVGNVVYLSNIYILLYTILYNFLGL